MKTIFFLSWNILRRERNPKLARGWIHETLYDIFVKVRQVCLRNAKGDIHCNNFDANKVPQEEFMINLYLGWWIFSYWKIYIGLLCHKDKTKEAIGEIFFMAKEKPFFLMFDASKDELYVSSLEHFIFIQWIKYFFLGKKISVCYVELIRLYFPNLKLLMGGRNILIVILYF